MTFDELEELMSEPPGGENHGRVRTEGGWRSLEPRADGDIIPYVVDNPEYRDTLQYAHGTRSRYIHASCRCALCRKAERDYRRRLRARRPPV